MDSRPFQYSANWQATAAGADPSEPADPWQEPSGTLAFRYQGRDLALALAVGNYWGYLYITVDGEPANRLPRIAGNPNSQGEVAGYRTFYAPEAARDGAPSTQWVLVHRATNETEPDDMTVHDVTVEVWRSWGQWPLRGVAVDALPSGGWPRWPGIAMLLCAAWAIAMVTYRYFSTIATSKPVKPWREQSAVLFRPLVVDRLAPGLALIGLLFVAMAMWHALWLLTIAGLLLLLWSGIQRPALWVAVFLVGLPFYFSYPLPLLPGRALGIVDVGVLGGVVVAFGHWLSAPTQVRAREKAGSIGASSISWAIVIALLASWALLCALEAEQTTVALREWRTVFAYSGLFALTLQLTLRNPNNRPRIFGLTDQELLINGWLLGGTIVATIALWHYANDTLLIQAEGVQRVRAFYGSPNNLALYLERSLAVSLALAMFVRPQRQRPYWWLGTLLQGAALLLTYSKGALLLALPTIFVVLLLGGILLLKRRQQGYRSLWWLVLLAGAAGVALLPSLATERFQQLTNLDQGTGFIRLQLWRSSWQMALDHPWFGVGPDNFLYAYRSEYILPAAWQEPNLNHPHNWVLDWWTRLGVPGLALALCWFALLLWRQWQHFEQGTKPALALGLFAATGAALAHGLIDASYALPDLMFIWVLMGYLSCGQPSGPVDSGQ